MIRWKSLVVILGASAPLLLMSACDGEEAGNRPAGRIVREEMPTPTAPRRDVEEEPDGNEPGELKAVDDAQTRYESGRPDELEGMEKAAAPLRYATTAIRMRGHAQDTLDAAQATRALSAFKAEKGRLPKTIKELRDWAEQEGWPVPEPSGDGVYVLDASKNKLIIVAPDTLD